MYLVKDLRGDHQGDSAGPRSDDKCPYNRRGEVTRRGEVM